MFRLNIQNTDLGRKNQIIIIGNIITGRTKSVTVKHGSHVIAIGKEHGCWSIPRLHHRCVILIEITLCLRHIFIGIPRLRNQDHNCKWKRHSVHNEELQRIVQSCRIGTIRIKYWCNLVELSFEILGIHCLLAGNHTVFVTTDCIDLTIVNKETIWMRTQPARCCVR